MTLFALMLSLPRLAASEEIEEPVGRTVKGQKCFSASEWRTLGTLILDYHSLYRENYSLKLELNVANSRIANLNSALQVSRAQSQLLELERDLWHDLNKSNTAAADTVYRKAKIYKALSIIAGSAALGLGASLFVVTR